MDQKPPKTIPHAIEVGARLRITREYGGLTQSEVGESLAVGFSAISKYETGKLEMPYGALIRFILAFQVTADWILLGDVANLDPKLRRHLMAVHGALVRTPTKKRLKSAAAAAVSAGGVKASLRAGQFQAS